MAATVGVPCSAIVLKVLTTNNYEDWSFQVKTYLLAKGLWRVVESAVEPPRVEDGEAEFEAWSKNNAEALHAIHISCGDDSFSFIRGIDTAKAAWNTLEKKMKPAVLLKREDARCEHESPIDCKLQLKNLNEPVVEGISRMAADTVVNSSAIVNELLDQDNYEHWRGRIRTYLVATGLWNIVDGTTERPRGKAKLEAWEKTDAKALQAINICCGNHAYSLIEGASSAKVAWNTLAEKLGKNGDHQSDDAEQEEEEADEQENVVEGYENNTCFIEHLEADNWNAVMQFIEQHPKAVRARTPSHGMTVLHRAVNAGKVDKVQKLLGSMTTDDLEIVDDENYTALDYCSMLGNDTDEMVEIAKLLVPKNEKLLTVAASGTIPLVQAYINDSQKMARYLYSVTVPLETKYAAELISRSFSTKRFDIAWDLIQRDPTLAIAKNDSKNTPLNALACTTSAFLSGTRLKFWERWIYDRIHINPTPTINSEKGSTLTKVKSTPTQDAVIDVPTQENDNNKQSDLIGSGSLKSFCQHIRICNAIMALFRGPIVLNIRKFFGITRIYQMKLEHRRGLEFLSCMCKVIEKNRDPKQIDDSVKKAIFQAAERGLVEFVTHIFKVNPDLKDIKDEKDKNLFQVAVECRQEKVFNLINGFSKDSIDVLVNSTDDDGNNMLHMVGLFSPFAQTERIRGAALQMQRELQWFEELKRMACPEDLEAINSTHDMKPREFFSKNHKELVKEGEKSMKETATSCTVVGALIVTMMFAAAFTLPGGNIQDSGAPLLLYRSAFKVFIIADAISLFTSTTSVMLFLGILTSRYAEDDFLISLPQKMILGLLTLFISVSAMVIVSASALFLILPSDTRIALPTTLLTGIPIASFIWMQFPFLVEIFRSTYIPGTFNKEGVPLFEKERIDS